MALVPSLSEETVGKLFFDKDGNVWVHESYAARPTATLRLVHSRGGNDGTYIPPGRERHGVVSAPIITDLGLREAVPEGG